VVISIFFDSGIAAIGCAIATVPFLPAALRRAGSALPA
jgi:hypothetical protein